MTVDLALHILQLRVVLRIELGGLAAFETSDLHGPPGIAHGEAQAGAAGTIDPKLFILDMHPVCHAALEL